MIESFAGATEKTAEKTVEKPNTFFDKFEKNIEVAKPENEKNAELVKAFWDSLDDNNESDSADTGETLAVGEYSPVESKEAEHKRPTPRESEITAKEIYGGEEQKSYKDGKEVPYGTPGSTRPDLVVTDQDTGKITAIEVKNYDLKENMDGLSEVLQKQISDRKENMPEATAQKIVLDVRGQDLSSEEMAEYKNSLGKTLNDVYKGIEIEFITD